MNIEDTEDEAFDELLRSVARTPDVSGLRREIGPGSELLQRFVIGHQLGEGGMGRVFAAFDRERQVMVAIKMLGVLTPHSIAALKREFRMAELHAHPNLVRLHELFSDGDEWFFTMELLDGVTLRRLVSEHKSPDIGSLRHIFRQLAEALTELHQTGILHGDLKPSNFLIVGAEQRVVLLDFGVSRPLGQTVPPEARGGTQEYCAPEQLQDAEVTAAADWYSYGVVLFEALTGKLPPTSGPKPEPVGVPPALSKLCLALLEEAPELRPDSDAVLRVLGEVKLRPSAPSASEPGHHQHRLIGRASESQQLLAAYERVSPGRPQVVLVRGDSGMGKTALMDHFVREVAQRGAIVLGSRCRERESTSYKAVDGLIDDLVKYLDRLAPEEAAQLLPEGIEALTCLFPTLRTASAVIASAARGSLEADQSAVKRKAVAAFKELLVSLSRRAKVVLWIDDLQWSDAHSAALLEPVLATSNPAALLLLGGCRAMGGSRGQTIDVLYGRSADALPEPLSIDLAPLAPADAEALAYELLPRQAETGGWARDIAAEAAGSPLFITELVHQHGVRGARGALGKVQSLGELVQDRLRSLPDDARGLLEATALAGVPLTRATARRCRGLTPNQTEEAIHLLRVNRLARTQGAGDELGIETHHDRIREIVVQGIELARKKDHHLRLAQALEAERTTRAEILASHYFAADQVTEAGRCWLKAAEGAFESLAFGHAAELYGRAVRYAGLAGERLGAVQSKQAEALAYDGKGTAAADVYLGAADGQMQEQAIELRRRAAEQLLLCGHLERGLQVIGLVLRGLGMRSTRTGYRGLLSILLGRLRVRLRGLRFTPRKAAEISQRELLRVDASWSIACSLGVIDFFRGADFQNDHLLLSLRAGEPRRILRAFTLEISYAATPGRGSKRRTAQLLSLATSLAEQVKDPATDGLVQVSKGVAAYLNGRWQEALVELQAGVHCLRRYSGMLWETVTAQRFIIATLFHLGQLRALSALVPPLLSEAEAKGNLYASVYFRTTFSNLAWLVADDVATARAQLDIAASEWRAPGTQTPHAWLMLGRASLALYSGDTADLWRRIEPEWQRLVSVHLLRIGALRIQLWHVRAWASLAEAREHRRAGRVREAQRLVKDARVFALRLSKERIAFARPLGGLALAAVESASGNTELARAWLVRCIEAFGTHGMKLHAAAGRARLGQLQGGEEAAALQRQAAETFAAEGVVNFERMLDLFAPAVCD